MRPATLVLCLSTTALLACDPGASVCNKTKACAEAADIDISDDALQLCYDVADELESEADALGCLSEYQAAARCTQREMSCNDDGSVRWGDCTSENLALDACVLIVSD